MRKFLTLLLFLTSLLINAQDNWSKSQKDVKQTIIHFFEGFHNRDTVKLKSTIDSNIAIQTIGKTKNGEPEAIIGNLDTFLTAVHNRPVAVEWEERLLDFRIDANTEIAQAWTPYEFYVNKKFSHCGVNIFQLFHDGKRWKIIALADTRKKEGCSQNSELKK